MNIIESGEWMKEAVRVIRRLRNEGKIPPKGQVGVFVRPKDLLDVALWHQWAQMIETLANVVLVIDVRNTDLRTDAEIERDKHSGVSHLPPQVLADVDTGHPPQH